MQVRREVHYVHAYEQGEQVFGEAVLRKYPILHEKQSEILQVKQFEIHL